MSGVSQHLIFIFIVVSFIDEKSIQYILKQNVKQLLSHTDNMGIQLFSEGYSAVGLIVAYIQLL